MDYAQYVVNTPIMRRLWAPKKNLSVYLAIYKCSIGTLNLRDKFKESKRRKITGIM